jgi:Domain of unknown function (4846)
MKTAIATLVTFLIGTYLFFSFKSKDLVNSKIVSQQGNTIQTRFPVPEGYIRTKETADSFGTFLRNLPLKPSGSLVKYYNGTSKVNNDVYDAVVDLPIGNKDLHQCADAVMRLRADYLFKQKQYNLIHFNFTNGFRVDYSKWREGYRITVKGNKTSWVKSAKPSDSYETYWSYMEMIFNYAGTASLSKEMKSISVSDLQIGDVFIKGGFPGHAVIVVDVAVNPKNNLKIFMIAQSYMPAQELQILLNPSISSNNSVCWYSAQIPSTLNTPEWTFDANQLKRF